MNAHQHLAKHVNNEKYLWIALSLTTTFIVVEIIGSIISNSLALLSDAAHLFTDASALIISITAMRLGRKEADKKRTFGYYRLEILAAAFNATVLFLVACFIFYEAIERFYFSPLFLKEHKIHTHSMLWVASAGVVINFISTRLLHSGSKESLNIKSAYIDAQADLLSSMGVILTALLIQITHWQHLDSLMAIIIALWILPRAWVLLKESINILLEGVPEGIELSEINDALLSLPGVLEVHDLHVWALTNGKISVTAHLVINHATRDKHPLLDMAIKILKDKFNILHTTIQIEVIHSDSASILH